MLTRTDFHAGLLRKLRDRTAQIAIIGLGYVGLPLTLRFSEVGYSVIGVDSDPDKIAQLNRGESYIRHIASHAVAGVLRRGFRASGDYAELRDADAIIICVPTPLSRHREPDLQYVLRTTEALASYLRPGQIVSLESTTYPGTTEEELKPRIEATGLKVGHDVFLVFSPEREDPGNTNFATRTIPKIVGGVTTACLEAGIGLYGQVVDRVIPVSSTRTAEMTKLLENIHRAVNIGLVNEMKMVADRMGIDIHEVIRAAATKPFGFVPYYPGPGLGGHCIPIDPFYLTWKAREYGIHTRFIELAGEVNHSMPEWVVGKIAQALNERSLPVNGCRVLILGIAYKPNVDDMRESPSVALMELLSARGADIAYHDPHIPVFPKMREHYFDLCSIALDAATLARFDCVVVATHHDAIDYALVQQHARLIVDTRGKYLDGAPNVVKA